MEDLFETTLEVEGRSESYRVVFEAEQYRFEGASGSGQYGQFSLRRAHDQWEAVDELPEPIRKQAIEALDRYLLQQH